MSTDPYKPRLEDVMRAAITDAVVQAALANPLRFPKRLQILVKKVSCKRKTSMRYIRAMENLRKSVGDYVVKNADKLPTILGDARGD